MRVNETLGAGVRSAAQERQPARPQGLRGERAPSAAVEGHAAPITRPSGCCRLVHCYLRQMRGSEGSTSPRRRAEGPPKAKGGIQKHRSREGEWRGAVSAAAVPRWRGAQGSPHLHNTVNKCCQCLCRKCSSSMSGGRNVRHTVGAPRQHTRNQSNSHAAPPHPTICFCLLLQKYKTLTILKVATHTLAQTTNK